MGVSVIIPTHNRANLLERALRSVFFQTHKADEVIVVDDGSSDATKEVAKKFNVRYLYTQNGGVARARNIGVNIAKSEWIAFLDDDDEWEKDKLEIQLAFHQNNPQYLCSYTDERWFVEGEEKIVPKKYHKPKHNTFKAHAKYCNIAPSSVMIRREFFLELGGFDEHFRVCEDFDLWLRILTKIEEFGYIDQKLLKKHAGHPNQLGFSHGIKQAQAGALQKHLQGRFGSLVQDILTQKTTQKQRLRD